MFQIRLQYNDDHTMSSLYWRFIRSSSYPVDVVVDNIQTDMVQRIESWLDAALLVVLLLLIKKLNLF